MPAGMFHARMQQRAARRAGHADIAPLVIAGIGSHDLAQGEGATKKADAPD
jgi:hypothetical protein